MRRFDFKDPSCPVSLPPGAYLKSLVRVLLRRSFPIKWSFMAGAYTSRFKMRARPKRRERMEKLLRLFMSSELSERELERQISLARLITRISVHTYAPVFRRSRRWLLRTFRPEGLEHLEKIKGTGCGVIILGSHAGLNTWVAPILRQLGFSTRIMQRTHIAAENLLLMRWERIISKVLPYPEADEGGAHLKRLYDLVGTGVWIQHVGDHPDYRNGLSGKYLGFEVLCGRAPWVLARLTGTPLIPVLVLMDRDFRFRLLVGAPIHVENGASARSTMTCAFQTYLDFVSEHVLREPWNVNLKCWEKRILAAPRFQFSVSSF